MGCTFVAAGKSNAEELVESVREGIYVRRMDAATVEPRTGRAVFRVTEADAIRNGRTASPLQPHLLEVDGPKALAAIRSVADDLTFDVCIGSCHRDGQPLAISVGAPTIWLGVAMVFA
jgi:TldD protein